MLKANDPISCGGSGLVGWVTVRRFENIARAPHRKRIKICAACEVTHPTSRADPISYET